MSVLAGNDTLRHIWKVPVWYDLPVTGAYDNEKRSGGKP